MKKQRISLFIINSSTSSIPYSISKFFTSLIKRLSSQFGILKVYSEFFDKKTVPYLKLTSNTLLNAEIDDEYGFVVMTASIKDFEKFGVDSSESVGNLANTYLNCGYKIAVILKEREDGIHCSFRSKLDYDVSKIAEKFGGGGHKNASGCLIIDSLTNAENLVEKEIKNYLKEGKYGDRKESF